MNNPSPQQRINPHLCWTIALLVAIIVVLIVVRWSIYPNFVERVNFAASLASLILAVLAIVYAFVSNRNLAGAVAQIELSANTMTENNARLAASLEVVQNMSGRIEAVDDKLSKLTSSPPPGAPTPALPTTPTVEPAQLVRAILAAGSWNGIKLIKACQLANLNQRLLDLRAFCATDPHTSYDYTYGYLVATAAVGLMNQESNPSDGIVTVTFFAEIARISLESEIQDRIARGSPEAGDVKRAEINAIERFMKLAPPLAAPQTASPPNGQR